MINPMLLENLIEITQEQLVEWKRNLAEDIDGWQKARVNEWIGTVGMLILLESPYAIDVERPIYTHPYDRQYFANYAEWRMLRFVPRTILHTGGFDIDDVKRVYGGSEIGSLKTDSTELP